MDTKNLNYAFNVEYYKDCRFNEADDFSIKNKELLNIPCNEHPHYINENCSFELQTRYPGLLIGVGNPHGSGGKSDIALGFTFDYVTGTPYIPGSSVKGVLRSAFAQPEYIKALLNDENIDVKALEEEIFEGTRSVKSEDTEKGKGKYIPLPMYQRDVFYDAFPKTTGYIMAPEAITPHGDDLTKNPTPLTLIKVKPNVKFGFSFKLSDGIIPAESKKELFKKIVIDLGMGAKTNVGFGVFTDTELPFAEQAPQCSDNSNRQNSEKTSVICPKCKQKNNKFLPNSQTVGNKWKIKICYKCGADLSGLI